MKTIIISANTAWNIFNFRLPIVNKLLENGFNVNILSPYDDYVPQLIDLGCEHFNIKIDSKSLNVFNDLKVILKYYKYFKKIKPVVILSFTPKPNIYGGISSRILKYNHITNISGLGSAFLHNKILEKIVVFLYKLSQKKINHVFFQNLDDYNLFSELKIINKNKSSVLPGSGVDLEYFYKSENNRDNNIIFLLIGRLISDKGIYEYVDAAKIIKRKYPNVQFRLLGFIDTNNPTAISERQINRWVEDGLMSWIKRTNDIRKHIDEVDCVVLPSYREGTPRTLLEAASMAKPIIAADSVGCREPVDDNINGFLCKVKDPINLADKMIKIIEMKKNDRIEMGIQGRNKMMKEFNINIVVDKYNEQINKIIRK